MPTSNMPTSNVARKSYPSDLTDEQGAMLEPLIPPARQNRGGRPPHFPRLEVIFGDNRYNNHEIEAWRQENRPDWRIEIKNREPGVKGFAVIRKRWVVERTNAWNGRARRNRKDYALFETGAYLERVA